MYNISMKNKSGFTIMELLVVIAILLILIAIVISSLSISQKRTRDDRRISTLQEIMLALEEYRDICQEYPLSLALNSNGVGSNNGCAGGNTSSNVDFGMFLSDDAKSAIQSPAQFDIHYGSFTANPGGRCTGYHIGIGLETSHSSLGTGDNLDSTTLSNDYCATTLTQLSSGFDGDSEDCSGTGSEDKCLDFKKGNP